MSPKLLTILLILIPVSVYYGYLDPLIHGGIGIAGNSFEKTLGSMQSEKVSYQNAINQFAAIELESQKVYADYQSVPPEVIEKTNLMIPDSLDALKLRNEVTAIADNQQVTIGGLTVSPDTRFINPTLGSDLIAFSLKARYPAFKKLMQSYEKNLRFYNIEIINIKLPDNNGEGDSGAKNFDKEALNINVVFRVYYLK